MQPEDVPAAGTNRQDASEFAIGGLIGHILDGRFLIERDLTEGSLGGGFLAFIVKDLENYCDQAVLKIGQSVRDDSGADGPSLCDVSNGLSKIGHANIEEVVETGRLADGRPFALTKLYQATPLNRLIEPGRRLELEGIAQLIEQISDGLAATHSKGILHCDLRPSNILIPAGDIGANNIRMINFGSAWPIDVRGESLVNVRRGSESLHYAAPELLVKLGHRSAASDIYSLAVLTYRLATGAVPFADQDRVGMLGVIKAGLVKPPTAIRTDLSDEAGNCIMSGLQFEPARRPNNVEDFGLRLVRLLTPTKSVFAAQIQPSLGAAPTAEPAIEPETALRIEQDSYQPIPRMTIAARTPVSDRVVTWALIIVLMAGALSIPIGQALLKEKDTPPPANTLAGRRAGNETHYRLTYWLEPSGPIRDDPGPPDKIDLAGGQLTFISDTGGHAYVFCEFAGEDGRPGYRSVFPSSVVGGAAKQVAANLPVTVPALALPQRLTPEAVWIVWTVAPNEELESIRSSAKDGVVSNEDERRLRHLLERNRDLRVKQSTDGPTGQTILDGSGERIVHRIELGEGQE